MHSYSLPFGVLVTRMNGIVALFLCVVAVYGRPEMETWELVRCECDGKIISAV